MDELKDYLILCKWPGCDDLMLQEDLDQHQLLCDRRLRPCRWMNCHDIIAQRHLVAHERACVRRDDTEYVCYFTKCYWRGGNRNLLEHIHKEHADLLIQEPETGGSVARGSGWLTWYMYVFDELFRCGFGYYADGDMYYQCLYIGPEVIGQRFNIEFELLNVDTGEKLAFVDPTADMVPGHLGLERVRRYDVNGYVNYTFRISRREVPVEEEPQAGTSKEGGAAASGPEGAKECPSIFAPAMGPCTITDTYFPACFVRYKEVEEERRLKEAKDSETSF